MSTMAVANSDNWQSGKTLSQSASFMLDNEIATDVTFTFPNATNNVKAHRFVLMARSHVFYVMLKSTLDKPEKAFEISDIDILIFMEYIKFLYTDEVTLSVEKALHLTSCAEKYEVTDLKAKCTHFLQTHIDETNVAMILDHAVLYNDDALISTCKNIIEPLGTLSCLGEHSLTKDTMELILGLEGLAVGELDIFKFCIAWAENECKKRDVTVNGSNRRKMLGPLLRKIPFCSMNHEEFATEVSKKHLLNGQEELQILRYFCGPDKSNPPFPCKSKMLQSQPQQNSDDDNIQIVRKVDEVVVVPPLLHTDLNRSEALGGDGCASRLTESMTSGDVLRRERNLSQDLDCYQPQNSKVGQSQQKKWFGSCAPQDDREAALSDASKSLEELHLAATPTGAGHQSMECEREAGHMSWADHELLATMESILNKMTSENFQVLLKQIQVLKIDNPSVLRGTVDLIFEKAIAEPANSGVYANLSRCMNRLKVPVDELGREFLNFRKLLLVRCQAEFEKEHSTELDSERRQAIINEKEKELRENKQNEEVEEELKKMKAEYMTEAKARQRALGNIRFIGELFKLGILNETVMHNCITKLLGLNNEDSLEGLCILLTTIGEHLDRADHKEGKIDAYFRKLMQLSQDKKITARIRFKIQDLIDLRKDWVLHHDDNKLRRKRKQNKH